MQAYANVATAPVRKTTQQTNRVYWEFRAAESSRGEDKSPIWYTVRIFKDEDPQLAKGDFVVFTGKLKNDVFVGRDGKPQSILTVMAFQLAKVSKEGGRRELVQATETRSPAAGQGAPNAATPVPTPAAASIGRVAVEAAEMGSEQDFLWLMSQ